MIKKAMLQQENEVLHQRVAQLEKQLATCMSEKSEERFRSLFEHAPVAYQSLDEKGSFLDVNPAYCKLTGYREDELIGRSFGDLWTPTTRSTFVQDLDELKRENHAEADLQLVRRDGTLLEVVWSGSVQRDEQGQFIRTHCILHNITERKRVELAFKEEQLRFAQIAAAIPGVLTVLRSHPNGRFNLLYASQAFENIFGLALTDLNKNAETIIQSIHPADVQTILGQLAELTSTLQPIHMEFRYQHPRKGEIWLENSAQPVREVDESVVWYGVTSDITARKKAEGELRDTRELFQKIFTTSPIPIALSRLSDRTVVDVNAAMENLLGYTRAELVGQPATNFDYWADPQERQRAFETLRGGESPHHFEFSFKTKAGAIGQALNYTETFIQGEENYFLSIFVDITERKQAEEKLREREEQYRFLLNNSSDFIARFDRNGMMLFGTEASVRFIGYRPEEVIHTSAFQRIHPEDHDKVRAELNRTLESGLERQMAYRVRRKSGEYIWVEATGRRVLTMAGEPEVIVVQRDITERKRAEEKLRESEESYRILFDTMLDGLAFHEIICDENGKPCDYRFLNINPAFEKLTGIRAADARGKTIRQILPSIEDSWIDRYAQVALTGQPIRFEEFTATLEKYFEVVSFSPRHNHFATFITDTTRRKHAEQALWESNEKYRMLSEELEERVRQRTAEIQDLYDNAPNGYHSLDAEGRIVMINQTELNWLGFTRAELLGQPFARLFTPASQATFQAIFPTFKQRGWAHDVELDLIRKDGSTFPVVVSATAMKDEAGNYMMSRTTVFNNTERKKTEAALQESEERYRKLIEFSPMAIIGFGNEARLEFINQRAIETLGGTAPEEFIGKSIFEFVHPDYHAFTKTRVRAAKQAKSPVPPIETVYVKLNGQSLPVVASGVAMHIQGKALNIVSFFDNSERKRAEEAVRVSLTRVNALYAISHGAMTATRMPELLEFISGTLVHALPADQVIAIALDVPNRQVECTIRSTAEFHENWNISFDDLWEGLSGWALRERAIAISQGGAPDDRESPAVKKRRKDNNAEQIVVIPLIYQDKLLGTLTAINRPDQKPFGPQEIELMQVIANQAASALEHFHTELALRASNHELERAIRVKDEFLANMSHELRTPLNGILGMSEILLDGYRGPLNDHQRNFVNIIEASGRHLLSLINDILDLSKIEADKMELHLEPVVLSDICEASLAFIKQPAIKKGVKVAFTMSDKGILIQADGRRLKQILVNLLSNAVKFTPPDGNIALEIHSDPENNCVALSVSDTGIGISETDQQHLFSPFTQVDNSLTRSYEGTGLGLTLVKRLTDLHGGGVFVESTPGQGSRFTITLPWQAPPPMPENSVPPFEKASLESGHAQNKATLLLVEDNPTNILAIGDYLDAKGYSLVYAHDGLEALAKAAESAPDLILMDIQMPKMDGLEATRRLRADPQFATIPIITLTAFAMVGDEEKCLAAGATGYMSKPVRMGELVDMIERLLSQ